MIYRGPPPGGLLFVVLSLHQRHFIAPAEHTTENSRTP
nr:MAG TPA: hypothetical protein [Caudoviricetes sp.]